MRYLRHANVHALGYDNYPIVHEGEEAFIFSDKTRLLKNRPFDAIILMEVLEHLEDPISIINELKNHLTPDGVMFIQTAMVNRSISSPREFPYWCYIQDETHVSFFDEYTFELMSKRLGMYVSFFSYNLIILDKLKNLILCRDEGGKLQMMKLNVCRTVL